MTRHNENSILFAATSPSTGRELWISDGTTPGTRLLKDLHPEGSSNPSQLTHAGNFTLFVCHTAPAKGSLWRTDGTADGSLMLFDFSGSKDSLFNLTALHNKVFFTTRGQGDNTWQLWYSDGSGACIGERCSRHSRNAPAQFLSYGNATLFSGTQCVARSRVMDKQWIRRGYVHAERHS
ncbi:MAG: hypothetical protein HC859_16665 [Bacteroidia bacterium]|nr:hypothetical protein [Bacteroidia bacterium]